MTNETKDAPKIVTPEQVDFKALRDEIKAAWSNVQTMVDERDRKSESMEGAIKSLQAKIDEQNKYIGDLQKFRDTVYSRPPIDVATKIGKDLTNESKSFLSYVVKGRGNMSPEERKYLVEDATGDILVPEDLDSLIIRTIGKYTVMRNLADVMTTKSDRVRYRAMTELTVAWNKAEVSGSIAQSNATPSEATQYVEDLYGLTLIGEDELADADYALPTYIADSFGRAIAETEDTGFMNGTGHTTYYQPTGITNGTTVTRVNAAQNAGITFEDLISTVYAVDAQYRKNCTFIVKSSTEMTIRQLKDGNGNFMWQPSNQAGVPNKLLGYNIVNQEDLPAIPTAGTAADVAVFGDIKYGYRIVDREGIALRRLDERYAELALVGFRVKKRTTGNPIRPAAMRILKVPA